MAASSDNSNSSRPSEFYGVEADKLMTCWDRTHGTSSEMNFNDVLYVISEDGGPSRKEVDVDILRSVIAKPGGPWPHKFDKLMMVNRAGVTMPAHLPNIEDVVGNPEVQECIRRLERGEISYEGATHLVPTVVIDKIDTVPPIPSKGPIYEIGVGEYVNNIGCGSDAFYVMRVKRCITSINLKIKVRRILPEIPTTRYWTTVNKTTLQKGKPVFPKGTTFVIWNALRITRPSFYKHFSEVIQVHKPAAIIITEARVQKVTCTRVIEMLGTSMRYVLDESNNLVGGALLLWDPTKVEAAITVSDQSIAAMTAYRRPEDVVTVSDHTNAEVRMFGEILPVQSK